MKKLFYDIVIIGGSMKKLVTTIVFLGMIYLLYTYRNPIIRFVMIHFVYQDSLEVQESNPYMRPQDWLYVQKTDNFYPNDKQDILNLFYTALDGGWSEVTFYCEEKYPDCMNDVTAMTQKGNSTLSNINNFVVTYNAYNRIYVDMNSFGRVNIRFERLYTEDEKRQIAEKVSELYDQLLSPSMSDLEKIKTVHDYIINHTVYDQEHADQFKNNGDMTISTSNTAYGPLFTGRAVCGGYTDAMALFLDKMGIPNYKISSDTHIWNLVYIDGEWKHLDLTWDDPVVNNGSINTLQHTYFLISTEDLEKEDKTEHTFDKSIYLEAK